MAAGNQNDNTTTTLLMFGVVIVVAIIIIKTFGNDIMSAFLHLRMWAVKAYLYLFSTNTLLNAYDSIDIYTPKEWTYGEFSMLSNSLRFYISIPLLLIFLPYAYKVHKKNPLNKFNRQLSRKTLCESEVVLWPWIAPVIKLNIIDEPLDQGDWRMSDITLTFCRKYSLLDSKNNLLPENARKVLIDQLGTLWTGIDDLKIHEKALLACFLAQLNMKKDDCLKGLSILARSISNGKIDYSFVDGYIKKYAYTEISEEFLNKNAYTLNVIATVYEESKKLGKIPPSYFLWLKPVDRKLFYTLQCVGRNLPFCEVAGIFGHGLAEKVIEKKCVIPYVDKGIEGLKMGLEEIKIID